MPQGMNASNWIHLNDILFNTNIPHSEPYQAKIFELSKDFSRFYVPLHSAVNNTSNTAPKNQQSQNLHFHLLALSITMQLLSPISVWGELFAVSRHKIQAHNAELNAYHLIS